MSRRWTHETRRVPAALALVAILLAVALVPACEESEPPAPARTQSEFTIIEGDIVLSDGWDGEWNVVLTFRDCNSGNIVVVEDIVDVICPGDTLRLDFTSLLTQCDGIVSGSRLDASCEHEFTVGGCFVKVSFAIDLERDDGTIVGTGIWSTSISGLCNGIFSLGCEQIEVTGTRLGPAPPCQ